MTTTPTPESIKDLLIAELDEALAAQGEALGDCDVMKAERDQALARERDIMEMLCHAQDERDKALARVKELESVGPVFYGDTLRGRVEYAETALRELQQRISGSYDECCVKREKAEARVAVLREALKKAEFHVNLFPDSFIFRLASDALATEDQAAEALLAERDGLKALTDELGRANKASFAREEKLKAQLDVAVTALSQIGGWHKDAAQAALAKIKDLSNA